MIYRRLYNYPGVSFRDTFEQLDRMRQHIERFFGEEPGAHRGLLGAGVFPQINMTEDTDKFIIRTELPGVRPDEIEMQATAKSLSIAGQRKIETENSSVRYHRREREAGKFSRIVAMPTEIEPDRIAAKMQNGVLTIFVPKAEAAKPRQITIK